VVIRRHLYPQTMRRRPPFVLGYDVVGEIDQLGDGVSGFQLGDRVADLTVLGSNAAYCTLRVDCLIRVPAGVDAAEAAALILSWTTAYQLLHRAARVQRGQRALVQGAAGAVGQALLVLGNLAGLELWGTAREAHAALIRELGATPIDYQHEDFTRVLPGGFDVVFDGIGEDGYRRSFAALKRRGLLCAYGYTAGVQARRRPVTILIWIARVYLWRRLLSWLSGGKRLRIYSINLMRALHPGWFREDLERLFGLLQTGSIRPHVAELPIRRGLAICHWMQGHLGETSGLAIVDRGLAKKNTGWDRMTEPPSSKNNMADRRVLEIMPIWRGTGSSNPYRSSGERSRASKQTGCRRSAAQCRDPTAGLRAVPSSAGVNTWLHVLLKQVIDA